MISMQWQTAKDGFLDRKRVLASLGRVNTRAMSQIGAGTRRDAQRSIKIRKGPSAPGQPPHGHKTGSRTRMSKSKGRLVRQAVSPLREWIWFSFDASSKSVVIGPVRLPNKRGDAPHALEHGGTSLVSGRAGKGKPGSMLRSVVVRPRPFMRPALAGQLKRLPELYRDKMR